MFCKNLATVKSNWSIVPFKIVLCNYIILYFNISCIQYFSNWYFKLSKCVLDGYFLNLSTYCHRYKLQIYYFECFTTVFLCIINLRIILIQAVHYAKILIEVFLWCKKMLWQGQIIYNFQCWCKKCCQNKIII